MHFKTLIPFIFVSIVSASDTPIFDEYHSRLCDILVSTSHSIDNYFIEDNSTTLKSKTYAELSTSMAYETKDLGFENDVRVRLRLNLPKIEKNLRLVFEDESSDNLLYDGTSLDNQQIQDKAYYLRLEYFKYMKDEFNARLGGGVKIRQGNLVPYLTTRMRYDLFDEKKYKSEFFNRLRYYTDGELENNFEFNSLYTLKDDLYLINRNNYYYNSENPFEILAHELSLVNVLDEKKQIRYGIGISSFLDKFDDLKVDYYHIHSAWYHLFYKKWVYYEVVPSILQRRVNNFETSYRILVNFGIYFNKYR